MLHVLLPYICTLTSLFAYIHIFRFSVYFLVHILHKCTLRNIYWIVNTTEINHLKLSSWLRRVPVISNPLLSNQCTQLYKIVELLKPIKLIKVAPTSFGSGRAIIRELQPVKIKVKQSHYGPGQAQRVPGSFVASWCFLNLVLRDVWTFIWRYLRVFRLTVDTLPPLPFRRIVKNCANTVISPCTIDANISV